MAETVTADTTSVEISGLSSFETYTFSVVATTSSPNSMRGVSEERNKTLSGLLILLF